LGGTTVSVVDSGGNAWSATPLFVGPAQVNYWLPAGVALGQATVTITNSKGVTTKSNTRITNVAPALFVQNGSLQGPPAAFVDYVGSATEPIAVCNSSGGDCVPTPINLRRSAQVYLEMYVTGIRHAQKVTVQIGDTVLATKYAGPQPQFLGLDQINVLLPPNLPSGTLPLTVIADTQISNTVSIAIQ